MARNLPSRGGPSLAADIPSGLHLAIAAGCIAVQAAALLAMGLPAIC
jgi:hypothetical protein